MEAALEPLPSLHAFRSPEMSDGRQCDLFVSPDLIADLTFLIQEGSAVIAQCPRHVGGQTHALR